MQSKYNSANSYYTFAIFHLEELKKAHKCMASMMIGKTNLNNKKGKRGFFA